MGRVLTQTVRGAGLSPAQSYILFTKVTLVVSKINYLQCLIMFIQVSRPYKYSKTFI